MPYRAVGQHGNVPQHGSRARYRKGCRCTPCREAENAYRRLYRRQRYRQRPPVTIGRPASRSRHTPKMTVMVRHAVQLTAADSRGIPTAAMCSCGWRWERADSDPRAAELPKLARAHADGDHVTPRKTPGHGRP